MSSLGSGRRPIQHIAESFYTAAPTARTAAPDSSAIAQSFYIATPSASTATPTAHIADSICTAPTARTTAPFAHAYTTRLRPLLLQIKDRNLRPVAQVQLAEDIGDVIFDRAFAQKERSGDLFVAEAIGNQRDDGQLGFG